MSAEKKTLGANKPVGLVITADDGGVGKTTVAVQVVTGFALAGKPLDLFQMDSKGKLAAKSGENVVNLLVPDQRETRGGELIASDIIVPWYRAVTAMPESGRSTLVEVGGAMAGLFHSAITDLDLNEDITTLALQVVVFVVCKAGEDSAIQLCRELRRIERNLPNAKPAIVLNAVAGDPIEAAKYLGDETRKGFASAIKRYPTIKMPRVRPRSMGIYERMHVLPSTIVSWHTDNYAEAIRRTGRPRDEAKILVKDIAEWSAVMQDEIGRILPFLAGGRDG
jgi:hypothetical protein